MHLYLVIDVVLHVHHQEVVALVNQLLVIWVVYRVFFHPVLYEEHRQHFNVVVRQKPLVFFVRHNFGFVIFEQ